MKAESEEIRRRFPRMIMNLVMVLIFWMIIVFIPPTVSDIIIPGINANLGFLVFIIIIVILSIFLIRVLSDALVLGDILTDGVVRRLGIKEERSPRRAARDFIYIIIIILVVTAVSPMLATVNGDLPITVVTYVALGLIILLIYDIGRILYRIIEQKAERLADRLAQMVEKNKSRD